MRYLFADAVARALEISEAEVYELARTKQLPFAICTSTPRRLFIERTDLPAWRNALEKDDCLPGLQDETPRPLALALCDH
jgi:hypothetical protein